MENDNTIKTIERLIREYAYYNTKMPKSIFISASIIDSLKTDYRLLVEQINENEIELTICGLKVYEVLQDEVIKVTD